ncbi:MAG: thioredoxin-dependent thiol peroxidase [Ktedonobacterales bacterium]|nr:thioredoxin-dependent thiol peroxidase [Ktedonobacterales bacterium]
MTKEDIVVGAPAPDFALPDDTGKTVKLSDFRGKRVVLYFYPKDDTPGCTAQACGFRDAYPDIEERNAVVIGISPDAEGSHQEFRTKYDLPFILLVDADHQVAEAYGVWEEQSVFGKKFMGNTRSHFLIDEDGKLADLQFTISPQDSVAKALAALGASA